MDLNYDGKCLDAVYRNSRVSRRTLGSALGFDGLLNTVDSSDNTDNYSCGGSAMIWSFGPDGKFDPSTPANAGVNKDNVLSWK